MREGGNESERDRERDRERERERDNKIKKTSSTLRNVISQTVLSQKILFLKSPQSFSIYVVLLEGSSI